MTSTPSPVTGHAGADPGILALCTPSVEPHWHALYTCVNQEKRVAEQLAGRAIEHFLPQYESLRCWKDRRVKLRLPLFPGYVFVRLWPGERLRVLEVPRVVRLVSFAGTPAVLPDQAIETVRASLAGPLRAEPHPYLTVGRRVRITRGPLEGIEGILIRKKNTFRVVVSLDLIVRSAAVEVDSADVERIS